MKRLFAGFLFAVIAFQGFVLPVAKAQIAGQSTTSAPGLPQGYSVMIPDYDRADDEIVQLNNLTIRGFSAPTAPAVIYASRDYGGGCLRYQSEGSSSGIAYPCPLNVAPTMLYQIQVNPDTILLLKNRTRASFQNFAIGDRINVYGFFDSGSQYMQALIVRDLDKPAVSSSRYIQLNGVTLISDPSSQFPPATFAVAEAGMPCYYYSGPTGYRTSSGICPMSTPSAGEQALPPGANASLMPYPHSRIYTVQVTASTRLLAFDRQSLDLSEFRMGDKVNIFGSYDAASNILTALILRDLGPVIGHRPPTPLASLDVSVTNQVQCIAAPCNPVPAAGATVSVSRLGGSSNNAQIQVTDNAGKTYFTDLAAGTYVVTANGSNRSASAQISLYAGEKRSLALELGGASSSRVQLNSVEPASVQIGGTVTLRGSGFTPSGNTIYLNGRMAHTLPATNCLATTDYPNSYASCETIVYSGVGFLPWSCAPGLMCAAVVEQLLPGTYQVKVVNAHGTSNSATLELRAN